MLPVGVNVCRGARKGSIRTAGKAGVLWLPCLNRDNQLFQPPDRRPGAVGWADPGCEAPGPSGMRFISPSMYRPEERGCNELRVTLSRQEIENVADPIVPALPFEIQRLDEVLAGL